MTIIAFISQKGGVGKSTLARAVAVETKKQKVKTLLVDCDPQQKIMAMIYNFTLFIFFWRRNI